MPIPPTGWGAVEILIWDTKNALEQLGHEVHIVNTQGKLGTSNHTGTASKR